MKTFLSSTSLKTTLTANFIGNAWTSVLGLLFIPYYLKYLGAEAYGLIGIFASLQTVLSLLDSGLSTTLNRELARFSVLPDARREMRNMVKTLEYIYWLLATVIGVIAVFSSPLLAKYWVHPQHLSIDTIKNVFILLSLSMVFQFPVGFYSGGLMGLQRHVTLNIFRIVFASIRNIGALLILLFYSNSVILFFEWMLLISVLQAIAYRYGVWYYLPGNEKTVFDLSGLKSIWRFAAGMTGISVTAVLFSQADRIVLSKILPLDQFGYYTIASTIGLMIYQIIGPVTQSYFPKFSTLIAQNDDSKLRFFYHQGSQLVSVLILPVTFVMGFFSKELLWIWTQDRETVNNTWAVMALFAIGTGCNGLLNIPFQLMVSHGWTKLVFYQNIVLLLVMIPALVFMASTYQAVGGALCWLSVNLICYFVTPNLLHRKLLKGELSKWYLNDTLLPVLVSFLVVFAFRFFIYSPGYSQNRFLAAFYLGAIGLTAMVFTVLCTKTIRTSFFKLILDRSSRIR